MTVDEDNDRIKFTVEDFDSPELIAALATMIKKLMETPNGNES